MSITRRGFMGGAMASGLASGVALGGCVPPEQSPSGRLVAQLRMIEAAADGTLGVELYNTETALSVGLNSGRRFGHCSSFKLSLAAKVLAEDASGAIDADRRVRWAQEELMFVSPFTEKRLEEGATLRELAEFTQKYSDNTAANVLLRELGGPVALTAFWRSLGDDVSRLDRIEPALNNVPTTEIRDTTTPAAMARTLAKLAFGDGLPEAEQTLLKQWMVDTTTGARRVRAGLPENWISGDKTGTSIWPYQTPGMGSLYVDIGFVEPPKTAPLTFAAYFRTRERKDGMDPVAEDALARVGGVLATMGEKQDWFPF
ncbi:MAG: class A beta-lactamase [Pseudomonadota bacterium]